MEYSINLLLNVLFSVSLIYFTSYVSFIVYLLNKNFFHNCDIEEINNEQLEEEEKKEEPIAPVKYEDKYLKKVRDMVEKEFVFTDDEKAEEEKQYLKLKFINETENKVVDEIELRNEAKKYVIDLILNKYIDTTVIEKTPIGNVAMFYDNKINTFTYYSDNTIPYRFLEVVARKYVLMVQCKQLYVDMEIELEKYEEKQKRELEEKKLIEQKRIEEEKKQLEEGKVGVNPVKKDVFAKFKSYNKEAGSGRVNNAPPPKNSIPTSTINNTNENALLKERANRYLCKGRFSNFNILKKVDRKKVDQKYALSFADFKKMNKKL
jgi:hypothetical protein